MQARTSVVESDESDDGIVGVGHLSPNSEVPQSGTAAFSAHGNVVTFNKAFLAVTIAMAAARPFVSLVMRKVQHCVKKKLIEKEMDIDCSGCGVFDTGPMNPMRVTSLTVDGVFTVETQESSPPSLGPPAAKGRPAESSRSNRGHCFEQSKSYRKVHPIAICFIGNSELLKALGICEDAKYFVEPAREGELNKFQFKCMRTQHQVKKTITSVVGNMQVAVGITKDKTPAGQCKAERPSLWRMEQGRKGPVVATHGLSSKSWLLFPSGSPAPEGVEVDTWYNVSVPVVTLTYTTRTQTPEGMKQEKKEKEVETELFFDLVKPSVVGVGAELPPDAVLSVRRCPTGQFNVRNEAGTYFREKDATNQKTHWGSIRADKLLEDNQWGDFAKMFVSSKSKLHDDLFGCEENGEFMFLIIEHCNEFSNFSSFFADLKERKKFCQSLRVGTSSEECGNTLPSFATTLREKRNSFSHNIERMLRAPNDTEIQEYQKIIESVENFLDAVQTILIRLNEKGCILADEKDLHRNAVDAAAKALVELRNSGPSILMNDNMLAELSRIVKESGTDREIKDDKIRQLLQLADVNMPHSLCSFAAQSGGFLHAFLSEGKIFSENYESQSLLFETMYLEAAKMPGLGPHCDGFPWPKNFYIDLKVSHRKRGQQTKNMATLTGLRLVSDVSMNGYERHADAISKSMMYIPVFTSESSQQLVQQDSTPTDANTFLFQLVLARELHETSKIMMKYHNSSARNLYPCALLRPIFLLTSSEIDDLQSSLGQEPMTQLQRCARQQLKKMGMTAFEQHFLSPHGLLSYYKDKKCFMVDVERRGHSIADTAAIITPMLQEISVEIQSLYMESMSYNFPLSGELEMFLSDASISRYAPILARHSIHSVQSFSTLDAATDCLVSVAKEAARGSRLSLQVESKLLLDTIAIAKHSSLSQPLSIRFESYIDRDASFLTAAFSSSALDILFSKRLAVALTFLTGLVVGVGNIAGLLLLDFNQLCDPDNGLAHFIVDQFGATACLAFAFLTASTAAIFRSPKLAKYILAFFVFISLILRISNFLWYYYRFMRCPSSAKNFITECCFISTFNQDKLEHLVIQKFSVSSWFTLQILYGALIVIFYAISGFFCVYMQSHVATLFALAFMVPGFVSILYNTFLGQSFATVLSSNFPWGGCAYYAGLKGLQWYGIQVSWKIANRDAATFEFTDDLKLLAKQGHSQSFANLHPMSFVLQQNSDITCLFQLHEYINESFQTWIGSLLKRGPQLKEQGVSELFDSPLPKSIAIIYDIDELQRLVSNGWRQPSGTFIKGPIKDVNRAIAKIYRAYAGDARRITDIVRCSVVLDSVEDINNFMMLLKAIGWVEQYEFKDAQQRVRQGQYPLDFGLWSVIDWRQKLQLLILFAWSYFTLYFLGLPPQISEKEKKQKSLKVADQNLARCVGDDVGNAVLSESDCQDAVSDGAAAIHDDIDSFDAVSLENTGSEHDNEKAVNACRGAFQIVRVKNRFVEQSPVGGYRDVNIKVRVGFKPSNILSSPVFVPVENWGNAGVRTVVCEIQVHLRDLYDAMSKNSRVHENYVTSRNLQSM